ncbi:MAG: redoxin domain-containing protein [Chloroflexi bacterium]|nr:redoxin domain-containing protein [Chloroflexota bacterium]
MNTQVLGISLDSQFALNAFSLSLGGLPFPLVTDFNPKGEVAKAYEIWQGEADRGHNVRATFIVDKEGVIRLAETYEPGKLPEVPKLLAELAKLQQ